MPVTWYDCIPAILDKVKSADPQSVLEVGSRLGKYGMLLRETIELPKAYHERDSWRVRIDGIETCLGYQNPLHGYAYNHVYYGNVPDLVNQLSQYDVVLLVDVLEHFEKDVGLHLLKSLTKIIRKAIIVSTQEVPNVQEKDISSHVEGHKSSWTNIDFCDFDFISESVRNGTNSAKIFVIYPQNKVMQTPPQPLPLQRPASREKRLTIGYFIPHHNLTGGVKMLLEQMRHLQNNGHHIVAYYRGEDGEPVIPNWFPLSVSKEILVPQGESILPYLDGCDIAVAGWLEQLPELAGAAIPVMYWEQGSEWTFGDRLTPFIRQHLQHFYSQPVALASVSPIVAKVLEVRFRKKSTVLPNGVDVDFYYPGESPNDNVILLVGNPNLEFKGFDVAVRTLLRVWGAGYRFRVKWITPVPVKLDAIPFPFPIEYVINPTQPELAELYRSADIFLFTSWYEGFGMPPLEAMSSGLPVVCTRCGGTEVYTEEGVNAMLANPGDVQGLADGVKYLLDHPAERNTLSQRARSTAMQFSSKVATDRLEQYLSYLVEHAKTS